MAAHGRPQLPVNGGPDLQQPDDSETHEYEKILNIHDQIFSGNHPRLKVPPHVVRKITPRSVQASPVSDLQGAPEPSAIPKSNPQWASQSGAATWKNSNSSSLNNSPPAGSVSAVNHTPASRVSAKTTSEIDPIFLTKSDDLVRAEIQLQRQRVERALRDQVENQRIEARYQALAQDANPDFDVSNVLEKALEIVKPVEPTDVQRANRNTTASDSFDENSFYSSRAPDSPQDGDLRPASPLPEQQADPMEIDNLDADAPVDHSSRTIPAEAGIHHATHQEVNTGPFTAGGKRPSPKQPENASMHPPHHHFLPQDRRDSYEEPEYSPPGPDVPISRKPSQDYSRRGMDTRRRGSGRMSGRRQNGRRSMSPRDVRVVRNHITSPAAPQPSRVSPLAVAKVPSITQVRSERQMESDQPRHDPARTSPEAPVQPIKSRKRRRMQDSGDALRHVAPRQAAESPRPYIKEEPVSPPPFSDIPPPVTTRNRQATERPVYVDATSPRYTPVPERGDHGQRGVVYEPERYVNRYDMASPVEPSIARVPSQTGYRRPMRDNQDLRRVASLQHARHPEIPQDYPQSSAQPRSMRATSYVVERPAQPERTSRYYEEPLQSYPRRYIQPEDESAAPAPRFHDNYDEMEIEPRPMGPPQRRIVVDEHGNQYYEPAPKVQQLPPVRHTKVDPYNERPQVRNRSLRASSIMEDPYGERRYVQEMPPPPSTYRRVTDHARSVVPERRPYVREYDDKEPVMRSGSVQVMDYPTRQQTAYAEDHGLPREDVVRVASVRPQHRQYEEPREVMQRVQSVRPGGREVSVYLDDEQRQHREYVPADRQGYGMARPAREERFYGDDDGDRMVIEGGREMHRLPPRY